jgi:hypothetical protein
MNPKRLAAVVVNYNTAANTQISVQSLRAAPKWDA